MKQFIGIVAFSLFSILSFGQTKEWTNEELLVLEKFGLDQKDHRGIEVIYSDCDNPFENEIQALEAFYSSSDRKKDISILCIKENGTHLIGDGALLSVHESITLYVQISKK